MTTSTANLAWTVPSSATSTTHLTQRSLPIPTAGPHQVLIRLTAASLNYRDLLVATRALEYPGTDGLPGNHRKNLIPCSDGAGVIHAVGTESKWVSREGTRVLLHPNEWFSGDVRNLTLSGAFGAAEADGLLQEWVVISDERVIEAPKHLPGAKSASLPTAGVTAWSAIREGLDASLNGELRGWQNGKRLEGRTVLTQGTGGVSCFAIQIAAALGARVIATSSSDAKLAFAKKLGATHGINYTKNPDWDQEVLRLTEGKGVDQVIELGGAQTLSKSIKSVRAGGLVSLIGILSAPQDLPAEIIPNLLFGGKIVKGCVAFNRDATAEFARFAEEHGIEPVIAKEFDFKDAIAAFKALQDQTEVGKIVINISKE